MFWSLILTFVPMQEARIHVRNEQWSEAIAVLDRFKPGDDQYIEYHFMAAVAHCRLNHKAEAIASAEKVVDPLVHNVPRRYRDVAQLIIWEAEKWKDNDLGDIYRDMKSVGDRLKNIQGGPTTQSEQKKILSKLDRLIKQKEDEAEQAKAQAAAKQQQKQQQQAKSNPLEDFQLPTGNKAKGEVDAKRLKEYADVWGKLPQKERAKAMTELTRGLPPKYRDAIESYFKRLERTKSSER